MTSILTTIAEAEAEVLRLRSAWWSAMDEAAVAHRLYRDAVTSWRRKRRPDTIAAAKAECVTLQAKWYKKDAEKGAIAKRLDEAYATCQRLREEAKAAEASLPREQRLENAVKLVLALHDNPSSVPRGYAVKLDPMAEQQLRNALEV